MQTSIHDTTIVTADELCTVHYDAAIAIAADRIVALGPSAELLARYPAAECIDGRGKAVMPGFANVHTHFGRVIQFSKAIPMRASARSGWAAKRRHAAAMLA